MECSKAPTKITEICWLITILTIAYVVDFLSAKDTELLSLKNNSRITTW